MDNSIEAINEATVFLVLSVLMGYTDGDLDPIVGSNIGFMLVGLVLFNILINLILFLVATVKIIYIKAYIPMKKKLCIN